MAETFKGWADKFLAALGAPSSIGTRAAVYAIIQGEYTQFHWNPLAISGGGTGANSSGVGNFPSESAGINATVAFLNTPGPNDYPGRIVAPLRAGLGVNAIQGFDASGAWSGDFPAAIGTFQTAVSNPAQYDGRLLPADPANTGSLAGSAIPELFPGSTAVGVTGVGNLVPNLNPLTGIEAIGAFFAILTRRETWIRFGELLAGVILVGVALTLAGRDLALSSVPGGAVVDKLAGAVKGGT